MIVLYVSSYSNIAAALAASQAQTQLAASQARGQVIDLGGGPTGAAAPVQPQPAPGAGLLIDKFV